jgi:hypothetical protein
VRQPERPAVAEARPDLQRLRRFLLAALDAHDLVRQFGLKPLASPERMMETLDPEAYRRPR